MIFKDFDIIILPTSPSTAFKFGEKSHDAVEMYLADIFTVYANLAGIPGISFPLGKHTNGMPFGVQADKPQLTPAQALDIAAYINDDSTPRGQNPNRIKLYTDATLRPQGFAIPEHFVDQSKAYKRAKFGPFKNVNENY